MAVLESRSIDAAAGSVRWRLLGRRLPAPRAVLVALFTVFVIAFGGGGSPAARPEMVVEVGAALALAIWIFLPRCDAEPANRTLFLLLAAAVIALPVMQLIPLPPSLWQALPGREAESAALALVGAANTWMPWSISPPLTLAALLSLGPPLAAMVMASRLDWRGRRLVVATIAVMGLVSVAVGTLQLSAGPTDLVTFYADSFGRVFGFQANRNAEVDVLLIAMVAGMAIVAGRGRFALSSGPAGIAIALAFAAILLLGAVLTGSRTGIALIPVGVLFALVIALGAKAPARRILAVGAGVFVLLAIAAFVLKDNGAVARVITRFAQTEDFRAELWEDTAYAIGQYWPVGAGLGTIVPVLISVERLEVVDYTLPNRAHNEYLELALEGGIVGLVLLALAIACVAMLAWKSWRLRTAETRPLILFAVAALIVMALHSIVDYPLRSMALAHVAGVAAGLLSPLRRDGASTATERESPA